LHPTVANVTEQRMRDFDQQKWDLGSAKTGFARVFDAFGG